MLRVAPLKSTIKRATRPTLCTMQTRGLKIDVENFFPSDYVPPTMANYRQKMSDLGKSVIYKWEIRGRRNNETWDSLMDAVKDSYKKTAPYKLNQEQKDMIHEYFGYSHEEIEMTQDYDTYMRVMYNEDGTPNWEKWKEYIGSGSPAMVDAISRMQETTTNLKKRAATKGDPEEIKRKQWELHNLDFSYFEGKIPSSTLNQVINNYKAVVERYQPDLDTNEMNRLHVEQLNRALTEIIDELGVMKKAFVDIPTEKIIHYGPMFQTDENGQPVWDYTSLAFIDRFFPEVRDIALREMAVENYRLEYPAETKKYATTYEDIITKMHKHAMDQRRRESEGKTTVTVSGNKRQMELARSLQNVTDLLEEASNLAREAQANKGEGEQDTTAQKRQKKAEEEAQVKQTSKEDDEFVWVAIEEQTGMTRQQMFGGRTGDYKPVDVNLMLDEEEKAAAEKK